MFKKISLIGISVCIVLFGFFSFSDKVEAQSCNPAPGGYTPTSEDVDCNFGSSCTVSDNCAFTTGIPGGPYQCELQKTTSFKTRTTSCSAGGTIVYTDGPCGPSQVIGCGAWQAQTGCTSNADCPNPPETMCATYCTGSSGNPGSCQQVDPSCAAFGSGGFYCGDGYCSAGETNANCSADCPVTPAPANFVLTADPAQRTITKGGATSYTITVSPTNGFNTKVALSAICPSGASCDITADAHQTPGEPGTVDLSYGPQTATLVVYGTAGIAIGNFSIDVIGLGSSGTHHVYPILKVIPGTPPWMNAVSQSVCPERSILLSWGASTYANYYKLYRNTVNSQPATPYKTVGNVTSDTDFPTAGYTYYYWVEAAHSPSGNYSAAQSAEAVTLSVCPPVVNLTPSSNSVGVNQTVTFTVNASSGSGLNELGLESTNSGGTPIANLGASAASGNSATRTFTWSSATAGDYYFDGYAWNTGRVLLTRSSPPVRVTVSSTPINGSCSTTLYSCTAGTSTNNSDSPATAPNYTWTCNGSNGGASASCSQPIPPPTNFVASCSSPGTTASFSWILPSGYTLSYFRVNDTTTGANVASWIPENVSDTGPATSFTTIPGHTYSAWIHTRLPSGSYSNSAGTSFTCVSATPSPTGTLSPASPSCTIASGASSCNVNLTWTTTNPVGISAITAAGMTNYDGNSGTNVAFTVPYSSRTFYLYNNAMLLGTSNATASCASGTNWNGSICSAVAPPQASFILVPSAMSFTGVAGGAAPGLQTLTVRDTSTQWISYSGTSNKSWCFINFATSIGVPPPRVDINPASPDSYLSIGVAAPNVVGAPGIYNCDITFTDTNASPQNRILNVTYTISPAVTQYTLTVNKTIGGSVTSTDGLISCGATCTHNYNQGSIVTLQAVPDTVQWRFVGWGGACSGTGSCVLTVDGNKAVTAQFRPRALLYQEF